MNDIFFFKDYGYTQAEIISMITEAAQSADSENAENLLTVAEILRREWKIQEASR